VPLQQQVEAWSSTKKDGDDDRACEWATRMADALKEAHHQVEADLVFGNEIINQRCLMATFLWRASQLERSAEVIREEFLDQSRQPGEDNAADTDMGWLADHGERLQRFNSGIDDIRQEIVPTIPLPVRDFSSSSSLLLTGYSSNKATLSQKVSGVKDETTNAIITETIDTRLKRLQELANGLRSLLDSKERMSRREMSRVLYLNQVETCGAWISAHMEKLETVANERYCEDPAGAGVVDKMVDIQQLRGAIGIAESIEAATQGNDTVLVSLQSAYNTYKDTLSGEDGKDARLDDYASLETKWQDLQAMAKQTAQLLLGALDSAEINNHINRLQETIDRLQGDIAGMDSSLLTDDHITQWQKQIDALDKNNYSAVIRMMASVDKNVIDNSLQQRLDNVGETILSTRNTLSRLYDVVNLNRLCKTYGDNANVVRTMIDDAQTVLLELQQTHGHLGGDEATIQTDRDSLLDAYQETKLKTSDCKEAYDDLCAYNSFIQTQKVDGGDCDHLLSDMYATQESVNASWKSLQAQGQVILEMATKASQLAHGYELLSNVEQHAQVIQTSMVNLQPSPSMEVVTSLQKKIRDETAEEMAEARGLLNSLEGSTLFGERYQQVAAMVGDLHRELDQHKRQHERSKLLQALTDEVARIQSVCEEQLKFIRQQVLANPDLVGKRPESINHISQTYVAAINNIEKVHEKCKDDYQVVVAQSKHLADSYNVPSLQLDAIKRPLCKALQDLNSATQTENEYIAALRTVIKHAKMEGKQKCGHTDWQCTEHKFC
jgi:hypothetical protein